MARRGIAVRMAADSTACLAARLMGPIKRRLNQFRSTCESCPRMEKSLKDPGIERFLGKKGRRWKSTSCLSLGQAGRQRLAHEGGPAPVVRVHGTLRPMNRGPIDDEEMVRLCFPMLNDRNRRHFRRHRRGRLRVFHRGRRQALAVPREFAAAVGARRAWWPGA